MLAWTDTDTDARDRITDLQRAELAWIAAADALTRYRLRADGRTAELDTLETAELDAWIAWRGR